MLLNRGDKPADNYHLGLISAGKVVDDVVEWFEADSEIK